MTIAEPKDHPPTKGFCSLNFNKFSLVDFFYNSLKMNLPFFYPRVACWEREVIGLLPLRGTFRAYKQIIRGLVGLSKQKTHPLCLHWTTSHPHHLSLLPVIKSLGAHAIAKA